MVHNLVLVECNLGQEVHNLDLLVLKRDPEGGSQNLAPVVLSLDLRLEGEVALSQLEEASQNQVPAVLSLEQEVVHRLLEAARNLAPAPLSQVLRLEQEVARSQ